MLVFQMRNVDKTSTVLKRTKAGFGRGAKIR